VRTLVESLLGAAAARRGGVRGGLYQALLLVSGTLAAAAFVRRPAVLALAALTAAAWSRIELRVALPERRALRWPAGLAPALVALACVGAYASTLDGDFLCDDFGYLRLFDAKALASFARLGDISEGIWGHPLDELRPLFALSYKLRLLLHGPDPRAFHAGNVLLHALNAVLVYAVVRRLQPAAVGAAVAAGLLFGLMPVHAEAVSWVTGTVDLLPTFFYLLAFLLFATFRAGHGAAYALALLVFALGLLSKEILITLPGVLLAYDALVTGRVAASRPALREAARVHGPFLLLAGAFLLLRRVAFDSFAREERALARLWFFLGTLPEKLRALLTPFDAWGPGTMLLAGLMLGVLAAAALSLRRRREGPLLSTQVAFFGLVWTGLTLLPLVVTYVSPRHLYLPSAGVAVALALVVLAPERETASSPLRLVALLLLLGVFVAQLLRASAPWSAAGRFSRQARAQLELETRLLAPGSVLLLSGLQEQTERLAVWRYALPFALQPPFVSRDAYGAYRVLEPHGLYCCPLERWWAEKRPILAALLEGDRDAPVELGLAHWNERRQRVVVSRATLPRGRLRRLVERALGAPFEAVERIEGPQAERLMAVLTDALRAGAQRIAPP
jgi:hypothetical protein